MNLMLRAAFYGILVSSITVVAILALIVTILVTGWNAGDQQRVYDALSYYGARAAFYTVHLLFWYAAYRWMKSGAKAPIAFFVLAWIVALFAAFANGLPTSILSVQGFVQGILAFIGLCGFYHWLTDRKNDEASL